MSLVQIHQSVCASCRLQSLLVAKQYARARVALPTRWSSRLPRAASSRSLYISTARLQNHAQDEYAENQYETARGLEEQLRSLDAKLFAEQGARQIEQDFDLGSTDTPLPRAEEQETNQATAESDVVEADLTPEQVARQAKDQFGDALPEDYLDDAEYKAYVRMYGAPIRFLKPGEEDVVDFDEVEVEEELDETVDVGTGVLRESKDGSLEEVQFVDEELDPDEELGAEEELEQEEKEMLEEADEDAAPQKLDPKLQALDQETLDALATLRVEEDGQDETDAGYAAFMRSHPFTLANRFGTPSSTLQLPKETFVDPINILVSNIPHKHVSDTAHRIFGGAGLPYSTATPKRGLTMQQKAIPLDPYQGRMSEIEADVYAATIMPGVYATAYSIMVETRKRLGSSWLEGLLRKEGGPRILDAGGAGAAVLAAREVLHAEWTQMHDTSEDPESVMDVAEAGGKTGGESIPAPVGKATVLTGSESLRHRASALLDDTTFLPRLPDYVNASDEQAREKGKFDIIFAPHTLWHIREDFIRKQHIANLWNLLSADGGVLILFEKGAPRGFEMVAAAREMLLDKRIASSSDKESITEDIYDAVTGEKWPTGFAQKEQGMIIAPCTNHLACPMYAKASGVSKGRKDHCHFSQRYIRPPFLQKILGAKDRNHEDVKFSYLSIMRGRDLRSSTEQGITQGPLATDAAFAGYENPDTPAAEPALDNEFDPTAPAIPDLQEVYGGLTDDAGAPHSLSLPRTVMPPLKRQGHVILDLCTPSGTLERWTVPRSFSKQAYRDARKAAWGDLWALGAKTRVSRNVKLGLGKDELGGVDSKGAMTVKGKSRRSVGDETGGKNKKSKSKGKGKTSTADVPYNLEAKPKEAEMKPSTGGRMRQGKVKGIRDKRDKKGTGHGRRKAVLSEY